MSQARTNFIRWRSELSGELLGMTCKPDLDGPSFTDPGSGQRRPVYTCVSCKSSGFFGRFYETPCQSKEAAAAKTAAGLTFGEWRIRARPDRFTSEELATTYCTQVEYVQTNRASLQRKLATQRAKRAFKSIRKIASATVEAHPLRPLLLTNLTPVQEAVMSRWSMSNVDSSDGAPTH